MCAKGEIKMSLIPRSVIDINRGSQSTASRKNYIMRFLNTDLDDNQITYFTYCINRLNAFRAIYAQSSINHDNIKIDRDSIEVEEIPYTEREIKSFIILQNSSIFSPLEYNQLYSQYIDREKELKQVI